MANNNKQTVDCRMIRLEIDFFLLSNIQQKELARYCALQIDSILSDEFFCHWEEKRHVKLKTLLEKIEKNEEDICFFCDANVLSEIVYDSKSFNAYEKKITSTSIIENWYDRDVSSDYFDTFKQYLPQFNDQSKCKEAIIKLFYEKGKIKTAYWKNHDASAYFKSRKYKKRADLYHGVFYFTIGLNCLNDTEEYVDRLINFAIKATDISTNINARIAISPIYSWESCNAYRYYFNEKENDNSHVRLGFCEDEWYPYYYLPGVDWFNLLSPLVASRLNSTKRDIKDCQNLVLKTFPNGTITVQSTSKIDELDVYELREIREVLYPVLYPRKGKILFKDLNNQLLWCSWAKPRLWWEHLPIFEDEISVDSEAVYFKYQLPIKGKNTGEKNTGDGSVY